MAKFGELSEEIQEIVDKIIDETGLHNYMTIKTAAIHKSRELIKVSRANAWAEHLGKVSDCVTILVYERALERLNPRQQEILLRDAINNISFDGEKDKIIIGAPKITVTIGGRAKYGDELINAAECSVLTMQQIIDEEREMKEAKKKRK